MSESRNRDDDAVEQKQRAGGESGDGENGGESGS